MDMEDRIRKAIDLVAHIDAMAKEILAKVEAMPSEGNFTIVRDALLRVHSDAIELAILDARTYCKRCGTILRRFACEQDNRENGTIRRANKL